MNTLWLLLIHWLHVLAGVVWLGGSVFASVAIWPALLRQPAPEARRLFQSISKPVGLTMGIAAQITLWLGILRGTWLGPITSFDVLFGSPYGHTFALALVLTLVAIAYSARRGAKLEARLFDGDQFRPDAVQYVRRSNGFILTLVTLVFTCMVLMRFGL